jgi:hypothetical protein
MRHALAAGLVLLVPALSFAQAGPYLAVVADPEVRLRAGPSDQFPDTGSLPKGTRVVVDHDESNGWVAVHAPAGAVSWVPIQFVDGLDKSRPLPQNVVVTADAEVTLAAGKAGLPQPLDVRKVKVPEGTILTVIGADVKYNGKTWLPVAPPPGDFRYVPKSALQFDRPANTSFTVKVNETTNPPPGPASPPPGGPAASIPASPPKPVVNNPLWAQAEQAEKDGKYDEAEKLLFELARKMNEPGGDHDLANLCYTRIHALREKKRAAGGLSAPADWAPPKAGDRPALLPPVRPTAGGPAAKDDRPPAGGDDTRPRWVGPGTLVRSALSLDGRRTYAMESSPGVVRVYVVPAPGVDLEKQVGRRVEVYGVSHTRRDLSRAYVVAAEVQAAQ